MTDSADKAASDIPETDATHLPLRPDRWRPPSVRALSTSHDDQAHVADDQGDVEVVQRKVRGLLNKLTMAKFDSLSDQIVQLVDNSEKEKDGRTLILVIRLVLEKATDEAAWSEMYARLCQKMMEQISPKVQDDGLRNAEGKPIAGGQLFRKYLLNRCQDDFEHGRSDVEARVGAGQPKLYSDQYYAAQKVKRQGLGLIKFIGELFKLQMLTERIMHQCVQKLLANFHNPQEEDLEGACVLLTVVGELLDTPRAQAHIGVYFERIELFSRKMQCPRVQCISLNVIELRMRGWRERTQPCSAARKPTAQEIRDWVSQSLTYD
ncbi:armadillo-type protein [Schizophyllum commune]